MKREGITGAHIPLLAKEGWTRHQKMARSEKARTGVVARESRLAMRFEAFACERQLLLMAAPCRACAGSARGLRPLRWLHDFLSMPQPPLLCKEGNVLACNSFTAS